MNATATKTLTANKTSNKAAEAPAANAMTFFQTLTAIAQPIAKLSTNQAQQDPKLAMRTRFEKSVTEQIKLVQSAAPKSRWFKKLENGAYELTVRNGNSAMSLNDSTFFQAKDAQAAVAFFEAVVAGAKTGEFDKALTDSMRKARAPKVAAPAVAADKK